MRDATGNGVMQRQLHHWKAIPNMDVNSRELPPWSFQYILQVETRLSVLVESPPSRRGTPRLLQV